MLGFGQEDSTPTPQGENPAPWAGATSNSINEARAKLAKGSKRSKKTEGDGDESSAGKRLSSADAERVRAMFDPKAWRTLVKTPFVLGQVVTGRSCWGLDKEEEDTLATTTAASAEYFLQSDPKWVCASICMFNWAVILTSKFMANAVAVKSEKGSEGTVPHADPLHKQAA